MRTIQHPDGSIEHVAEEHEIAAAERAAYRRVERRSEREALEQAGIEQTHEDRMRRHREQVRRGEEMGFRSPAQLRPRKATGATLGEVAALLVSGGGNMLSAVERAKALGLEEHAHAAELELFVRDAVNAGSVAALPMAAPIITSFVAELSGYGLFDRLLADMQPLSLMDRRALVIGEATATIAAEGAPKPVVPIAFDAAAAVPMKALAQFVVGRELLNLGFDDAAAKLQQALLRAVAKATDSGFLGDVLGDSTASTTSTGSVLGDVAWLLANIRRHADERLTLAMHPTLAGVVATLETASGEQRFPGMTPSGGTLAGLPVATTDGIDAGTFAVLDARGLAGASGAVDLAQSEHGTIELHTEPGSGSLTSLWQSNLVALRAERYFAATTIRDDAVASIEDADYAAS